MHRCAPIVLIAVAACVGDDPSSVGPAPNARTDSGTTTPGDSGSGTAPAIPPADAGTDAGPTCVAPAANILSWWRAENDFTDHFSANPMAQAGSTGMVTFAAGHVGKAFAFDGTRLLERQVPIGIASLGALTVEAWVKANTNANARILDRVTAGLEDGWLFDLFGRKLRFRLGAAEAESSTELPTAVMIHVAGTFDGSTIRVFVNGVESGQASSGGVTTVPAPNHPLRIGGASDFGSLWNGLVDEAAIYSRALAPVEIKAIYEAATAGRCM